MSDKAPVQLQLASNLASFVSQLDKDGNTLIGFLTAFWSTIVREWLGIDRLRLDKFYLICRNFHFNTFKLFAINNYDEKLIVSILDVYKKTVADFTDSSTVPLSLRFHFIDSFFDEFEKFVLENVNHVPNSHAIMLLFSPFIDLLGNATNNQLILKAIKEIFEKLLLGDDKFVCLQNLDLKLLAKSLFDIGAKSETRYFNRQHCYAISLKINKLLGIDEMDMQPNESHNVYDDVEKKDVEKKVVEKKDVEKKVVEKKVVEKKVVEKKVVEKKEHDMDSKDHDDDFSLIQIDIETDSKEDDSDDWVDISSDDIEDPNASLKLKRNFEEEAEDKETKESPKKKSKLISEKKEKTKLVDNLIDKFQSFIDKDNNNEDITATKSNDFSKKTVNIRLENNTVKFFAKKSSISTIEDVNSQRLELTEKIPNKAALKKETAYPFTENEYLPSSVPAVGLEKNRQRKKNKNKKRKNIVMKRK